MLTPVMRLRPTSAPMTMDNRSGGLDQQLQLAAVLTSGEHHEPWQVQHDLRRTAGNVNTHWGLLRSVAWSLWIMKAPALYSAVIRPACRNRLPASRRRAVLNGPIRSGSRYARPPEYERVPGDAGYALSGQLTLDHLQRVNFLAQGQSSGSLPRCGTATRAMGG
jgi:hypothetical protein